MIAMKSEELPAFIQMLRSNGVSVYVTPELSLTLAPQAPSMPAHDPAVSATCNCGHSVEVEHSRQGCLHGCDARICDGIPASDDQE
jgi:hypothetical protein